MRGGGADNEHGNSNDGGDDQERPRSSKELTFLRRVAAEGQRVLYPGCSSMTRLCFVITMLEWKNI